MKAQVGTDFAQASTSGATPPSVYTASHWERCLSTLMTSQRNAQSRDRLYRRGAKSQTEQNFLKKKKKGKGQHCNCNFQPMDTQQRKTRKRSYPQYFLCQTAESTDHQEQSTSLPNRA